MTIFAPNLLKKIATLSQDLLTKNLKITCAESCTGGLLSSLFTEISGSSQIFDRGFVVYSNQSKVDLLKVDDALIKNFGVVSKEVALSMSLGALDNSRANIAIAITGFIDLVDKPYNSKSGEVFIAIANSEYSEFKKFIFEKTRSQNRESCLEEALNMLEIFLVKQYSKLNL